MKYKFPFFGEGEASYFEFIGLNIRFENAPSATQVGAIIEVLPLEYGAVPDDVEGKWCNLYSEFGYGHIDIAIPNVDKFNEKIQEAVIEVNDICPIQFVYRSEDHEAGGTKYNEWHYESKKRLIPVIEEIEAELSQLSLEVIENLKLYFVEILSMYEMETSRLEALVWNPMDVILKQIKEGEIDEAEKSTQNFSLSEIDSLLWHIRKFDADIDLYPLIKVSKNSYLCERIICNLPFFTEVLYKINEEKNTTLLEKFKLAFVDAAKPYELFNKGMGYKLTAQFTPEKVVQTIDFFISTMSPNYNKNIDSSNWVNAMYFLIPSNEKRIPIDKRRCLQIIERALPYGPQNPGVYWNCYCLYAAIGEIDKAFECLENTIKYKLNRNSLLNLIEELKTSDGEASILNRDPRFEQFLQSFLEKAKPLLVEN